MKYLGATLNNQSNNSLTIFGQRENDNTLWQGRLDDKTGHRACLCCIAPSHKKALDAEKVEWINDQTPAECVYTTHEEWQSVLSQHHSEPKIYAFV